MVQECNEENSTGIFVLKFIWEKLIIPHSTIFTLVRCFVNNQLCLSKELILLKIFFRKKSFMAISERVQLDETNFDYAPRLTRHF